MKDRSPLRLEFDAQTRRAELEKQHQDRTVQLEEINSNIIDTHNRLIDFLANHPTKTEVVNQKVQEPIDLSPLSEVLKNIETIQGKDGKTPKKGVDYFDGKDGKDGEDGDSAYDVWLKNGNTGTEEDFLESIKGKDGKTPIKGLNYFDGKDGRHGESIKGDKGEKGDTPDIEIGKVADGDKASVSLTKTKTGVKVNLVLPKGEQGKPGKNGISIPGYGVSNGGNTGQVLAKKSEIDYDTEWVDQTGGTGGGLTNLDGGNSLSMYLITQNINCEGA